MVACLAIYSSHWATYFAAIFIIATAVTELEFLQNLAAIIRKNESYFKYKKEELSVEENRERNKFDAIKDEIAVSEGDEKGQNLSPNSDKISRSKMQDISRSDSIKLSFEVESKAIEYLAKEYPRIERGVRFKNDSQHVELDGLVQGEKGKGSKIFEIKWLRNEKHIHSLLWHAKNKSKEIERKYFSITGEIPEMYVVLVSNFKYSLSEGSMSTFKTSADENGINVIFLTLSDLGFEVEE
tara:strand:- start:5042 stop:5761 length:720 start_codon:yes stop_codon:yes gene_type:complete